MAVEVSRLNRETLAKYPGVARIYAQAVNVLLDEPTGEGDGNVIVPRVNRETLGAQLGFPEVYAQNVNVLLDEPSGSGSGNVEVARLTRETGMHFPSQARVYAQNVNVLLDEPSGSGSGNVEVSRLTREILGRCVDQQVAWSPTIEEFFAHNWATFAKLSTAYQTDIVQASETLAEKRRSLINRPERTMRLRWSEAGRSEVDKLLVQLRRFGSERMTVPLYMDQSEVTAESLSGTSVLHANFSEGRYFPNTPILIVETDHAGRPLGFSTNTIAVNSGASATLQNTLSATTRPGCHVVFPLIRVHEVLAVNIENLSDRVVNLTMEVTEVLGKNAIPASTCDTPPGFGTYNGIPIFCPLHDWSRPLKVTFLREGRKLRLGRGETMHLRGPRHRVEHDIQFTVDRTDMWEVFRFFDSRRGRALPFWLMDQENLWEVVDHVGGGSFLGIDPLNSFTAFQDEMEYVGIEYTDGLCTIHQVITIQDTAGQWRLTLAPGDELLAGRTVNDVHRVGRARICRNKSDEFTEEWQTTEAIRFTMKVVELFNEGSVTL